MEQGDEEQGEAGGGGISTGGTRGSSRYNRAMPLISDLIGLAQGQCCKSIWHVGVSSVSEVSCVVLSRLSQDQTNPTTMSETWSGSAQSCHF